MVVGVNHPWHEYIRAQVGDSHTGGSGLNLSQSAHIGDGPGGRVNTNGLGPWLVVVHSDDV